MYNKLMNKHSWKTYIVVFVLTVIMQLIGFSISAFADEAQDEKAKEYVYSIFDLGKLSPRVAGRYVARGRESAMIDPTMRIAWIVANWDNFSEETRNEIRPFVNPEALREGGDGRLLPRVAELTGEMIYKSAHFEISYSTTDSYNAVSSVDELNSALKSGANGTPDYIDKLAYYLEDAYTYEITTRGFPKPGFARGESRYLVYVVDLLTCGFTHDSFIGGLMPCGGALGVTGSFDEDFPMSTITILDRSYNDDISLLKDTVSHEFFHSIQFGRSDGPSMAGGSDWYYEGTATWMMDEYTGSNRYISFYLVDDKYVTSSNPCDNWFRCTNYSINTDDTGKDYGTYVYGKAVFFKYLTDYLGKSDAVNKLGDYSVMTKSAIQSLRQYVSSDLGSTMSAFISDFGTSFLYKSKYEDGGQYNPSPGFAKYNVEGPASYSDSDAFVRSYSYKTYEFYYAGEPMRASVSAYGSSGVTFAAAKCAGSSERCESISPGDDVMEFGDTYKFIYLVVANGSSDNNPRYSITVDVESPVTYQVLMEKDKWNLLFFPVSPYSKVASNVFGLQDVQKVLISKPYMSIIDPGTTYVNFKDYSSLWTYNESSSESVSVMCRDETSNEITFSISSGEWAYIGTPDLANATPYSDAKVTFTFNSVNYGLSEAISANLMGALYEYDSASGAYQEVTPQTGMLQPWTAYVFKGKSNGTVTIRK